MFCVMKSLHDQNWMTFDTIRTFIEFVILPSRVSPYLSIFSPSNYTLHQFL
jgi:hypothetical protein